LRLRLRPGLPGVGLAAGRRGLAAGGRLALAEYERLVGHGGVALRERDAMSAPALIVTLFVVLGNTGDLAAGLAARRRRRKARGLRPGAGGTRTDDETGPGD